MDKDTYMEEVIICKKERRGSGKDEASPIRIITQVYNRSGMLIGEDDPYSTNVENIADFMKHHFSDIPEDEVRKRIHEYFIESDELPF